VDRALSDLATTIESGRPWPRPSCPNCESGYIGFAHPTEDESHESAPHHGHDAFEPDWVAGTFVVRGQCENGDCQLAVHGTGDYKVAYSTYDDDYDSRGPLYSSYYKLTHLHPPMLIMPIPEAAPAEVREGVLRASRVLFADSGLAATALRSTVERFLTTEGIPSISVSGRFQSASERIHQWLAIDPNRRPVAELLSAVKWLGNAGTHEDSDLTTTEVLEGATMLDEALHRLYTGPDIDAHAQTINTAKGPSRQL
jgi:hypothetical protein